jgi:hypothetical protein
LRDYERGMRGINAELARGNLELSKAQLDEFHRERQRTEKKRGIASAGVERDRTDKRALDQYDAARAGIAGNVAGDANYPALDEARPGGIQPPELKGGGEVGMLAELMEEARAAGRVDEYLALREALRQVESEGIVEVLRAARTGANETQLRDIYNSKGQDKVTRVVKRKEKDGRIVLEGYKPDGSMVEMDVDQWEAALGLKPKQKWKAEGGIAIEENSGAIRELPPSKQFAPNSYFLTTKDADGNERIFDLREMKYVDGQGNAVDGGLSRKDADGILSALTKLFKVSDIESMTEEGREKMGRALGIATQIYKNGAVDSQGRKLTPAEAAAVAGDVVDGRLSEADAIKRFLPPKPAANKGAKPPIEGARQASDGKWYVQKEGKWHQWVPEANAAPTHAGPAQPAAAAPKSGMRAVKPPVQTPERMPIVGGINDAVADSVGGIGRVLRGESGVKPLPAEAPIEGRPLPAPDSAVTDFTGQTSGGIAPAAPRTQEQIQDTGSGVPIPADIKAMTDEQIATESLTLNKDLDRLHESIERAKKLSNEAMLRRLENERTEKIRRLNMLQREIRDNRRVRGIGVAHG